MKLTEHRIQAGLFKWAKLASAHHPELTLLFAIPNGGARDPITGAMLKAEGVKRIRSKARGRAVTWIHSAQIFTSATRVHWFM